MGPGDIPPGRVRLESGHWAGPRSLLLSQDRAPQASGRTPTPRSPQNETRGTEEPPEGASVSR